jgi:hypothetical protein
MSVDVNIINLLHELRINLVRSDNAGTYQADVARKRFGIVRVAPPGSRALLRGEAEDFTGTSPEIRLAHFRPARQLGRGS